MDEIDDQTIDPCSHPRFPVWTMACEKCAPLPRRAWTQIVSPMLFSEHLRKQRSTLRTRERVEIGAVVDGVRGLFHGFRPDGCSHGFAGIQRVCDSMRLIKAQAALMKP